MDRSKKFVPGKKHTPNGVRLTMVGEAPAICGFYTLKERPVLYRTVVRK